MKSIKEAGEVNSYVFFCPLSRADFYLKDIDMIFENWMLFQLTVILYF
jgi:hypothetical protein